MQYAGSRTGALTQTLFQDVVVAVLDAVKHGQFDALYTLLSADIVYQDPRFQRHGIDALIAQFKEDQQNSKDMVWETTRIASNGGLMMMERVDKFTMN
jgi:limonene-1,2-epoxide hydrolase